jgi:hypothetical protein
MLTLVTPTFAAVHYGIPVSDIGDDGDLIAPGHHEPRRVLAAFNRYARTQWGYPNLAGSRDTTAADLYDQIRRHWGVFRAPNPAAEHEDPGWEWVIDHCTADTPGAAPYTQIHL